VELVDTDSVALPALAIEVGLKLLVAPPGNPLTFKLTVPVKPLNAVTVVV
jgi:hypothetical protein